MHKSFFNSEAMKSIRASLICILIGLLVGYLVLALINAGGSTRAIWTILLNFMSRASAPARLKALGNTLTKTAPLLMCALSICFCYKVGLFNIGAAGQYEAGAGIALYAALVWQLPWYVCVVLAALAGALFGALSGFLKARRNVNEVISGIMLNWILLYVVNAILSGAAKDPSSPYTKDLSLTNPSALLPTLGLNRLFANNQMVTIAVPLAILLAVLVAVVLEQTKFGFELKATGYNKEAARYAGMKENRNIIITLTIGGALAGLGAAFLFLSGYQKWEVTAASVPSMGFNGIAATFLGALNPIGTIFSSFFIQSITDGGAMIDRMLYPSQVSDLISAIIIYLCGFMMFVKEIMTRNERRKVKKQEAEKGGAQA